MKSFVEYIKEDQLPFSAFGISRSGMPQIADPNKFITYLNDLGVKTWSVVGSTGALIPTQSNYEKNKVGVLRVQLRQHPDIYKEWPSVIVSEESHIADGHHRYIAAHKENSLINIVRVELPINKLLRAMIDFNELAAD